MNSMMREGLNTAAENAETLRQNLRNARTPLDFQKLTANLQRRIDNLFAAKLAQSGHTIACKAGCGFCCYMKVDALPIEIFLLAEHIKTHFSKDQVNEILGRTKLNREKIASLSADDQKASNIPCPLLQNGRCICYSVRPITCRRHHSHSVAPCEAMYNGSAKTDMRGVVQEIKYTLAPIMVSTQNTFMAERFDSAPYDLSSALNEALSNPKCYKRWRQGKGAFSKALIAKDWKEADRAP